MPRRNILRTMFGLDWRSLALMRMGLAAVILADLFICAQHLTAFYTDDGVLPRANLIMATNPVFGLYQLSGSAWWAAGLFILEAVSALMMFVGYRTRLATALCWFLLVSRQARNPLLLFGADIVLRIGMFWAMFLPLNRRYSLDAVQGRVQAPTTPSYLGAAGIGAITQFLLVYIISGMLKTGPSWRVDHTAVYYALAIEIYSRPLGTWLNQFDGVTAFFTVCTLYLEIYGPLLFILPVFSAWGRMLGFVLFALLQVGFGITMEMGLFWAIMIVVSLMFLPTEFWTWLVEPLGRRVAKWQPAKTAPPIQQPTPVFGATFLRRCGRLLRDGGLLALAVVIVLYNVDTLAERPPLLPARFSSMVGNIGLDQYFNMFAPDPQTQDGWLVVRGWLQNGRNVDLRTGDFPASFAKPAVVAETYGDERMASWLIDLTFDEYAQFREGYLDYLARQWNQRHSPAEQVKTAELIFVVQINGLNHYKSYPTSVVLWTEYFN